MIVFIQRKQEEFEDSAGDSLGPNLPYSLQRMAWGLSGALSPGCSEIAVEQA